ncbi:MAG: hypothetical protein R3178_10810, partial [Rhodothermales bacterium]|nr:hypothetical protein [Rhodothermales bacterium]
MARMPDNEGQEKSVLRPADGDPVPYATRCLRRLFDRLESAAKHVRYTERRELVLGFVCSVPLLVGACGPFSSRVAPEAEWEFVGADACIEC